MKARILGFQPIAQDQIVDDRPESLTPAAERQRRPASTTRNPTTEKLDWLDGVAADHGRVNPTSFKVAFVVAQHVNKNSRVAWPSQERLARLVGVSETTLRACLKTLVGHGHLTQEKWGKKNNNRYRLRHQHQVPDLAPSKP